MPICQNTGKLNTLPIASPELIDVIMKIIKEVRDE